MYKEQKLSVSNKRELRYILWSKVKCINKKGNWDMYKELRLSVSNKKGTEICIKNKG